MHRISLKIDWFEGGKKKKNQGNFGHMSFSLGLKGSLHEHCTKVLIALLNALLNCSLDVGRQSGGTQVALTRAGDKSRAWSRCYTKE